MNWARASKLWFPISNLPTGGTPVVLANEDQSIQWFCEKPNREPLEHERHARDENGRLKYHERPDPTQEQKPVVERLTITPAWWSPAVFVDENGQPVHQ